MGHRLTETQLTKAEWRKRARSNQVGLRIDHERVCRGLRHFLVQRREKVPTAGQSDAGWVVAYSALPGEPDLEALLTDDAVGPFALTRTPADGMDLTLHPLGSRVETHRYGFAQPVADAPSLALEDVDVVLVPGLAFDMTGARLGHGAGYYDRLLARLGPSVTRVGVSSGYIVADLPTVDHDVRMTHLATEAGVVALTGPL